MSSVNVNDTPERNPALVAGNTNANLTAIPAVEQVQAAATDENPGLPSAAVLDHIAEELHAAAATIAHTTTPAAAAIPESPAAAIGDFSVYVTRAEFDDLLARLEKFNARSGQKI